jgi:Protein of unknown function (DUF2000)
MSYLQNDKKFVAVLNRKHPMPRLLNGVCHATAGLAGQLGCETPQYLEYINDADAFVAAISRYPFIVLEAKNGNQLATLRKAAADNSIANNVFISAMVGQSAQQQMDNTKTAAGDGLDYMVVVLFGEATAIDPITKKFSLFKGQGVVDGVSQ